MSNYEKTCIDEIDFEKANQMHAAALQISKTCFDFKKLCVSFIGVAMAFIIKFTDKNVDHSMFAVGLVLIIGFLISDATAYYYQKSLRRRISIQFKQIAIRNQIPDMAESEEATVINALLNPSMSLYYILAALFIGSWIGFSLGWLG
jgi:TPP-dependent 2-oxoacid decarboxylase